MKEQKCLENWDLLDVKGAASFLLVPTTRIYYEVFKGRLPHYKMGASLRFSKELLIKWLEEQKRGGSENE